MYPAEGRIPIHASRTCARNPLGDTRPQGLAGICLHPRGVCRPMARESAEDVRRRRGFVRRKMPRPLHARGRGRTRRLLVHTHPTQEAAFRKPWKRSQRRPTRKRTRTRTRKKKEEDEPLRMHACIPACMHKRACISTCMHKRACVLSRCTCMHVFQCRTTCVSIHGIHPWRL